MIRAQRPAIVSVERRRPGQVSPGDTAEAKLPAGLIALLESSAGGNDVSLGAGYHARYNIPVSLASTAALAVLAPAFTGGVYWAGRDLEVEWMAAAASRDTVIAKARLEEFSDRLARFTVCGRNQGEQRLYQGTLRMMAMCDGYPAGFRSRSEYEALCARMKHNTGIVTAFAGFHGVIRAPEAIPLGGTAAVELEVSNREAQERSVPAVMQLPPGGGLSLDSPALVEARLAAGRSARLRWTVRADRPHEVNLGRPWELRIVVGEGTALKVSIQVPDPNPGRTFYLLTEDCETFDGGPLTGNYAGSEAFGNHNNFMDPEDYRVQMILKPDRLNRIAERYGARWTHFYAATQRFGAEWAARQSATGEWDKVIAEMDASVRTGSKLHDYCPHIHFDYEPDSALPPQPRLVYDQSTDGILPNDYYHPETNPTHRYHDWDGSARGISYLKRRGDWSELDSKTGSMRKSLAHLARLQANRRAPIVARTGSYDFGKAPEDQAISTDAYAANGLRGNSDAYRPGAAPAPGGQMFWCAERDRQQPVSDLSEVRLVQLAITMDSGFGSAEEMNRWFEGEREASRGPGVHAILFTSHAMFFGGEPDRFWSLEGGAFEQLERHLAWVRDHHPDVEFATASEAVLEYLDYYTPALEAHTEPLLCGGDPASGRYEFPVRLLGQGIRVDEQYPARVRIAAPACFSPAQIREMRVTQKGRLLAVETEFDCGRQPSAAVELISRAPIRLEIVLRQEAAGEALAWFQDSEGIVFHDPPEGAGGDLLRLRPPAIEASQIRFYNDLVRLLMHPIAGHTEPLGRRVHPLGGFTLGAALTAAFQAAGEIRPEAPRSMSPRRIKLRWLKEVDLGATFVAQSRAGEHGTAVRIRDDRGVLVAEAEVTVDGSAEPLEGPGCR